MKEHATNADDLQLAQLGHAQSFERQFSRWTMLGLSFAILNSWTALAASLSLALPSGGPIAVCACSERPAKVLEMPLSCLWSAHQTLRLSWFKYLTHPLNR